MYNSQQNVYGLGATQIVVGLSAIVRVIGGSAYQIASSIKILSGSGTLWIAPAPGVSLTGAAAGSLIVNGYPLAASEVFNIGGPATFYLAASGATMTAAVVNGYSAGFSLV